MCKPPFGSLVYQSSFNFGCSQTDELPGFSYMCRLHRDKDAWEIIAFSIEFYLQEPFSQVLLPLSISILLPHHLHIEIRESSLLNTSIWIPTYLVQLRLESLPFGGSCSSVHIKICYIANLISWWWSRKKLPLLCESCFQRQLNLTTKWITIVTSNLAM